MANSLRRFLGIGDEQLADSDEVLVTLKHRAAYRVFVFMSGLLMVAAFVMKVFDVSEPWQTVSTTLFVVFFVMGLVYEVILAYDGYYQGEDELRARLHLKRSTVIRKSVLNGIVFAVYFTIIYLVSQQRIDYLWLVCQSVGIALVMAWLYYRRWRSAIRDLQRNV